MRFTIPMALLLAAAATGAVPKRSFLQQNMSSSWDGPPPEVLIEAERVAQSIFSKAGVELQFVDCRERYCPGDLQGRGMWLHLLPGRSSEMRADALGYAALMGPGDLCESYAGIFYRAVTEAANQMEADVSELLGAALAHEIGHVLLGRSHSLQGVMSPRFTLQHVGQLRRGELRFSKPEAQHLAEELARRRDCFLNAPVSGTRSPVVWVFVATSPLRSFR